MTEFHHCNCCPPLPPGKEPSDFWETDRWTPLEWQSHLKIPRTCSGCGGVHPEDVLRMLSEGWTDEICDDRMKGYLNPPGLKQEYDAWTRSDLKRAMRLNPDAACPIEALIGLGSSGLSKYPESPIKGAPVKFYIAHFTAEQLEKLNELTHRTPR